MRLALAYDGARQLAAEGSVRFLPENKRAVGFSPDGMGSLYPGQDLQKS